MLAFDSMDELCFVSDLLAKIDLVVSQIDALMFLSILSIIESERERERDWNCFKFESFLVKFVDGSSKNRYDSYLTKNNNKQTNKSL